MATHRSGYFKTSYGQDLAFLDTPYRWALLAALLVVVMAVPIWASRYVLYVIGLTFITIMGSLSLNLLIGFAGQISLGHAAFLAIGAFTSYHLSYLGLPFLAVIPLSTLIGGAVGLVVGAPALRLRGLYLVLTTIGLHYIVVYVVNEYQTSGSSMLMNLTGLQMPVPNLGLVQLDSATKWYYFLLAVMVLVTIYCANLGRTRPGRAWIALRDRDITAAALGINVALYKLLAFVVSSALTCLSGALMAYFVGSVSAEYFTLTLAVTYLAMVVIGGSGSVTGAYLGAIFVTLMPYGITGVFALIGASSRVQMLFIVPSQIVVFGLMMVLFLIFEPRGLVGVWNRIRAYFELWPLRQSILSERRQ